MATIAPEVCWPNGLFLVTTARQLTFRTSKVHNTRYMKLLKTIFDKELRLHDKT